MNIFRSSLMAAAAVSVLSFASCKKKSDDASPNYGSASYNGMTWNWKSVGSGSGGSTYSVTGSTLADLSSTDTVTSVSVTFATKPTASGDVTIDPAKTMVTLRTDKKVKTFAKAGEKITATVNGDGTVSASFNNLTETDALGAAVTGGKTLSGSVIDSE